MVASSIPMDDYQVRHPIVLGEGPRKLEILVEPATGQFDRHSAAQLREFASLYRKFGRGPITIMPPALPRGHAARGAGPQRSFIAPGYERVSSSLPIRRVQILPRRSG